MICTVFFFISARIIVFHSDGNNSMDAGVFLMGGEARARVDSFLM